MATRTRGEVLRWNWGHVICAAPHQTGAPGEGAAAGSRPAGAGSAPDAAGSGGRAVRAQVGGGPTGVEIAAGGLHPPAPPSPATRLCSLQESPCRAPNTSPTGGCIGATARVLVWGPAEMHDLFDDDLLPRFPHLRVGPPATEATARPVAATKNLKI